MRDPHVMTFPALYQHSVEEICYLFWFKLLMKF